MKLTFLHHSTYLLETTHCYLLFDAYRQQDIKKALSICDNSKTLYILCTHAHSDHYSPDVFEVDELYGSTVKYIFHSQVKSDVSTTYRNKVQFIETYSTITTPDLEIKSYGSTDEGGSFRIHLEDHFTLFFAGDLNNWHWNEEADDVHIKAYEAAYQYELNKLIADEEHFDLLFFPTDHRLGKDYLKGLKQLVDKIDVSQLAPMHLNGTMTDRTELEDICRSHHITLLFPEYDGITHTLLPH